MGIEEIIRGTSNKITKIESNINELDNKFRNCGKNLFNATEAEKDIKQKLSEIGKLGEESECPTCERPLKEHYSFLRSKYETELSNIHESLERLEKENIDLDGKKSKERD